MRRILAVIAAKMTSALAKLTGHQGTNIGGELALRLCPDILTWFGSKVRDKIIFVTGTNGKTSTNNMIYSIIRQSGHSCVCNQLGANMNSGLISAFINSSTLGSLEWDYTCLEVDEASLPKVMAHIKPHIIVFTNIFADQLDRHGEMDALLDKIKTAIKTSEDTVLLINADDPALVSLGDGLPHVKYYYGVETETDMGSKGLAVDGVLCKKCGNRLHYNYCYYGQLGHYICKKCGFTRPVPDFRAFIEDKAGKRKLIIWGKDKDFIVETDINISDTYSIYNTLAAASCGALAGNTPEIVLKGIETYRPQVGRMEKFYIQKPITLNLAKNPIGFNESMKVVSRDSGLKTVAIGINDLPQDGRDVSWLWDTNFEILQEVDETIYCYILFGQRRYDVALRLKYAGVEPEKLIITEKPEDVVDGIVKSESDVGYILLNYSLLFDIQKILKERNEDNETYHVPSVS